MINKSKIISAIVSLFVLGSLVMLGPARAFILDFSVLDESVILGDPFIFQISAELNSDEFLNLTHFTLNLIGPKNVSCIFLPNGTKVSECLGINVIQIEKPDFGYGYGYGYGYPSSGFLKYNITLDTKFLIVGEYLAELLASLDNQIESAEIKIEILLAPIEVSKCSIRAKDGEVIFQNKTFEERNKLNLYFPINRDGNKGKGELSTQKGKERLSYKFDVKKAFRLSANLIRFEVSGTLKHKTGEKNMENAVVIYYKDQGKIDIDGESLMADKMNVNFVKGCEL